MSTADIYALHRLVAEVANFEGIEEEIVADDSPVTDCLPGQSCN
jgi:hypothetical protein